MRILIVEDDNNISRPLMAALKTAGYAADVASDGERGYFLARLNDYSLLILDYNLPKMSGREIIKKIRADGSPVPIIITTIHGELDDKIDLLTLGADDYLTKPFALSELLARIRAVLRRPKNREGQTLRCGGLELNPDKFLVTKNGQRIDLPSKEFALLEYLLKNKGRILTRQEIMEHVWDENADPFSNTIEVHIWNLRKKLETKNKRLIFTFSNRGYKLDEQK